MMPDSVTGGSGILLPEIEAAAGQADLADSVGRFDSVVSAADVFGPGSRLAEEIVHSSQPLPIDTVSLAANLQYHVLVILLFVLLCFIAYRYRACTGLLFSVLIKKTVAADKIFDEQSSFFKQFIGISLIAGALLAGGAAAKIADTLGFAPAVREVFPVLVPWTCWIIAGIAVSVTFYKILLINILGFVTGNKSFFEEHHSMSRFFFVAWALVISPVFLVSALGYGELPEVFLWLFPVLSGGIYIIFLRKSYIFFRERKVSILQWILYLCAVEFFPISFLVLLGIRN